MDNTYLYSMREHLAELKMDLHGLSEILQQRELNRYEYRAAERTLQIVIESCIGIAKHWVYAITQTAPSDAYAAFETLSQQGVIGTKKNEWRKIIGMRNALVHDYLNIEPEIIKQVIKKRYYKALFDFAGMELNALEMK